MYQWGIQVGQWCHPDPAVALPASVEQFCRPFLGFATIGRKNEIGQVVSHGFLTYYTLRQSNMAMKNPWKSMKILQKGRGFYWEAHLWGILQCHHGGKRNLFQLTIHLPEIQDSLCPFGCLRHLDARRKILPARLKSKHQKEPCHPITTLHEASLNQAGYIKAPGKSRKQKL